MYKFINGTFITLKAPLEKGPRMQSIGWACDHLRKISDNFLVVQESNKKNAGNHFHALALMKKKPHKGWFKKGVHIHLTPVGDLNKKKLSLIDHAPPGKGADFPQSEEEFYQRLEGKDEIDLALERMKVSIRAKRKRQKMKGHVDRIISYMTKETKPYSGKMCLYVNGKKVNPESRFKAPVADSECASQILPSSDRSSCAINTVASTVA